MSYTYLQGQGEVSSAECFADIPPSLLLKSIPIVAQFSYNDSETESCHGFLSGTTQSPLTGSLGEVSSTSFVGVTPVRETATLPGMVFPLRAWEMSFCASLGKSNPSACLERILSQSDETLPGLQSVSETPWKTLGIRPSWSNWGHVVWEVTAERCDHGSLAYRAPNARDWKGMSAKSWRERQVGDNTPTLPDQIGGVPHPEFAEELMLWPTGWSGLEQLGMDKIRSWLSESGRPCAASEHKLKGQSK